MDRMQAEQIATSQLDSGERLLWSGSPSPRAAAVSALPAVLFGLPFAAFACFWIAIAWRATSQHAAGGMFPLFPLFGLPFLLVGMLIVFAPLWSSLGARGTVYAVTDRRAMIITSAGMRGVQSYTHDDLSDITLMEGKDGTGSVFFAARSMPSSRGYTTTLRVGFIGIPEARHVEQLIRSQLKDRAAA